MKKEKDCEIAEFDGRGPEKFDVKKAKEDNVLGRKLLMARKENGLSLVSLSEKLAEYDIDVQKSAVHKWELGQTVPNTYQFLALCDLYHITDPLREIFGREELNEEGRRKLREYREDLLSTGMYAPVYRRTELKYREMPLCYIADYAGIGNFLDDGNFKMVNFPEEAIPKEADCGIKIAGDSMEPVYSNGQLVWVKRCETIKPGEVGVFILNGEGYIKRLLEQEPADTEAFTDINGYVQKQKVLISYNRKYAPIEISKEDNLTLFGKVLS